MKDGENTNQESFKVSGDELLGKIKEIIREGNARRVIIKNEKNEIIMEFPLTVGAIGVVLAPIFAAVSTLAALASHCTIVVEKKEENDDK